MDLIRFYVLKINQLERRKARYEAYVSSNKPCRRVEAHSKCLETYRHLLHAYNQYFEATKKVS
jgi:hypothetical protein